MCVFCICFCAILKDKEGSLLKVPVGIAPLEQKNEGSEI